METIKLADLSEKLCNASNIYWKRFTDAKVMSLRKFH